MGRCDVAWKNALLVILVVAATSFGVGCRTTEEFNPFSNFDDYEIIVVEDFGGPGTVGFEFAERVARSLASGGRFRTIERSEPEGRALRMRGNVVQYKKGNPALRLRYGRNVGNARVSVEVRLEDYATGDFVASFRVSESYEKELTRTILHQDLGTLAERAADAVAERVESLGE